MFEEKESKKTLFLFLQNTVFKSTTASYKNNED